MSVFGRRSPVHLPKIRGGGRVMTFSVPQNCNGSPSKVSLCLLIDIPPSLRLHDMLSCGTLAGTTRSCGERRRLVGETLSKFCLAKPAGGDYLLNREVLGSSVSLEAETPIRYKISWRAPS